MKKLAFAAATAVLAMSAPAFAATDGALSTTSSTGDLQLNVNIPKMVRVSGLNDLTIDVTPAMLTEPYHSREDATDHFCVYSNDGADGAYSMAVTGTAGSGAPFALSGPAPLPYYMWTSDNTNQFKSYRFNGSTTSYLSNGDGNGRRTTLDCSVEGDNATIKFGVNDSALIAAQAGTYTDTVTVTVSVI
ncbi:MAG TPA: hypothetical protein PKC32_00210 [Sphingopyxis sp.]|jgi:hypothetical protein|uniref:hypothetical protein n=1 Tax=Sphingopyxis sp. TaxID=1908224 RepID=UPI002C6FF412|nr:hypothetical protein [Sphingopyxis sp.]HEX2812512.1 hypothetical protein [Sphingopyxis sp.]HMN52591.1 hypothetical protein [Sphingopyxis sp.]